jgi:DNA-binding transcriptional LysR family regulator
MELRHLRYFAAVAEELHFGRAAARLNISAPTLSHQISALENILGARLLTRKTKSTVALTQPGKRFLIEAYATLKQAEQAETIGRRAARGDIGSIAVGYIFSAGSSGLIPSTIVAFREAHPDISIQLARKLTFEQFRGLSDDTLDVGFTVTPPRYPTGLTGFIVDRHPYFLAIPAGHPAATRKSITPAIMADEDFVAVSLEMEVGFGGGNIAAITPPGVTPRIAGRAPDIFSVLMLVAAGVGMSVIPHSLTNVKVPGIVYRKVSGTTRTAPLSLVYRKNEASPVVKAFIEFLRKRSRSLNG